jgi:hypothetical protein
VRFQKCLFLFEQILQFWKRKSSKFRIWPEPRGTRRVSDSLRVLQFHTALLCSLLGLIPSLNNLSVYHSHMSSFAPEEKPVHPIETFRNSTDYRQFESTVIRPFLREARGRAIIYADSQLGISTAPGRPSIEDIYRFLTETDYNRNSQLLSDKSTSSKDTSVSTCPVSTPRLVGYISEKHPDCFVLEEGFFEKGLEVILGSSGRRVRILGVCGLGRNYVMMKVIELGGILQGEVSIQRMAVSSRPSSVWIATLHWIVSRLFKPVLGSMLDFADEEKMEDSM